MENSYFVALLIACPLSATAALPTLAQSMQFDTSAAAVGTNGGSSQPTLNMGGKTSNATGRNNQILQQAAAFNLLAPQSVNMSPYPSGQFSYGFPNEPAAPFMGVSRGSVGGILPNTATSSVDINIVSGPTVLTGGINAMGGPPGGGALGAGAVDTAGGMNNLLNPPDPGTPSDNIDPATAAETNFTNQVNAAFTKTAQAIDQFDQATAATQAMAAPAGILTPTQATQAVNTIDAELASGQPITNPTSVPMVLQSNLMPAGGSGF
jgi:hypothetical protein